MLTFETPEAFSLLLLPALMPLLRRWGLLCSVREERGEGFEMGTQRGLRKAFGVLLFVCLTVAAAGPVQKTQHKEYLSHGADIVFAVDSSPAMGVKDIDEMSRLDALKDALAAVAVEEWGANLALVEMGQEVRLLVPLTQDRCEFLQKLNGIKAGAMGSGCAIGDGLVCASRHLEKCTSVKKSIVVISCGENITGTIHPHTASRIAKDQGASVYVLGVGKRGVSPIEYEDPQTLSLSTGYIDSGFDSSALADIAFQGRGSFFEAQSGTSLASALNSIKKAEDTQQSFRVKTHDKDLSFPLLVAALICLLLSWGTAGDILGVRQKGEK